MSGRPRTTGTSANKQAPPTQHAGSGRNGPRRRASRNRGASASTTRHGVSWTSSPSPPYGDEQRAYLATVLAGRQDILRGRLTNTRFSTGGTPTADTAFASTPRGTCRLRPSPATSALRTSRCHPARGRETPRTTLDRRTAPGGAARTRRTGTADPKPERGSTGATRISSSTPGPEPVREAGTDRRSRSCTGCCAMRNKGRFTALSRSASAALCGHRFSTCDCLRRITMPRTSMRSFYPSPVQWFYRKDHHPPEVATWRGQMANTLWFYVEGNRHALVYDHPDLRA